MTQDPQPSPHAARVGLLPETDEESPRPDASAASEAEAHTGGPPPLRSRLLERLLLSETDLEEAFDRLATKASGQGDSQSVRAVIPGEALTSGDLTLAVLLTSVLAEYEDIEEVLSGLHELESTDTIRDEVVVIREEDLADPNRLHRSLEAMQSESERFEFLFATAKGALDRLDVFDLSRRPTEDLVMILRSEGNLGRLQALVEFLRHLQDAAESFEALALPTPHIRDYLRQLYTMGDWREMGRLVHVLAGAVSSLYSGDGVVGRVPIDAASGAIDPGAGARSDPEA